MRDTGFFVAAKDAQRVASLYETTKDQGLSLTARDEDVTSPPAFESGGGGLVGTLDDYGRFCASLLGFSKARIIAPRTIAMMATNQLTPQQAADFKWDTQRGYGYGLGVRVLVEPAKGGRNGSVGEFGWDGKASTWMEVDPAEKLFAVLMLQLVPNGTYGIAERVQRMIYAALLD